MSNLPSPFYSPFDRAPSKSLKRFKIGAGRSAGEKH